MQIRHARRRKLERKGSRKRRKETKGRKRRREKSERAWRTGRSASPPRKRAAALLGRIERNHYGLGPHDVDLVANLHLRQRGLVLHFGAVLPVVRAGERD